MISSVNGAGAVATGAVDAPQKVASQVAAELAAGILERIDGWDEKFVRRMALTVTVHNEKNKAQVEADHVNSRNINSVERYVSNPFNVKNAILNALQDAGVESSRVDPTDVQAVADLLKSKVTYGVLTKSGVLGRVGSPPGDVEPMYGRIPDTSSAVAAAILSSSEPKIAEIAARLLA